ncbi:MAG: polysaccharide biosynthesis tyrosine autokinase [Thiohalocapsa sp.]|nr:polysaccharide biosynthesis tyrosine autokinase [Thiohalocapsa sp.]MCF7992556.1 polysaccharide biosynthesis tyrosine autokinase [Thiohalocapsa sp.]
MNSARDLPVPDNDAHQLAFIQQAGHLQRMGGALPPPGRVSNDDVLDLREYWRILMRRKGTILLTLGLAVVIAVLATFQTTPIYRSTLMLQIETTGTQIVDYGSVVPEEGAGIRSNQDFYKTQYELLKSRTLARRVIDQLGLETIGDDDEGPSFFDRALSGVTHWATAVAGSTETTADAPAIDPALAAEKEEEDALLEHLSVEPVRDSRLVRIHYDSTVPTEAVAVANAIAANFINLNLERRFDASSYAKHFLEDQLAQMRATLEESEKRFVAYAREREIVNMDDRLEIILNKLREMNTELVQAEAERIEAESAYQELRDASDGAPDILESELVASLKQRRSELEAEYQEQLEVFKPGYPAMQQLRRQIDEVTREIARETGSVVRSVQAKYQAKVREEAKLTQRIAELKEEALALQDRSTDYETLRREVETNRELYDGLLQRMKEVGVAAGIGENNISVVDPATIPILPYKPDLKMNLAIAIALGLFLGVLIAFLLELLDDTANTPEEVEALVGAAVLTLVPRISARKHGLTESDIGLLAFKDPKSAIAESARSLRTQLLFSTAEGAPKILHFASSGPGEGKTTTAVGTAIAFAQAGAKVLLIDADLRNPSLHRVLSLPNSVGLTNHIAGTAEPVDISRPTPVPRLFAITSGPLPPNPVELLSGAKMLDLLSLSAERFDQVIIDGPPVIGLADALVLANLAKATLFVVDPEVARKREIEGAVKRLYQANAYVLGAVLSKVGRGGKGYGYGYGYSYQYSYGQGQAEEPMLPRQETA